MFREKNGGSAVLEPEEWPEDREIKDQKEKKEEFSIDAALETLTSEQKQELLRWLRSAQNTTTSTELPAATRALIAKLNAELEGARNLSPEDEAKRNAIYGAALRENEIPISQRRELMEINERETNREGLSPEKIARRNQLYKRSLEGTITIDEGDELRAINEEEARSRPRK